MKLFKRAAAICLTALMLSVSAPTAYGITFMEASATKKAGESLSEAMRFILEVYKSSDAVTAEQLRVAAMRGMMDALDQYSYYLDANEMKSHDDDMAGHFYGIGVGLDVNEQGAPVVTRVFKNSPAEKTGLKKGDVITSVGGKDVTGLGLYDVIDMLDASVGSVRLEILQNGLPNVVTVAKAELTADTVYVEKLTDVLPSAKAEDNDRIGYMLVEKMGDGTAKRFIEEVKAFQSRGVKRLIIDLRGNLGGDLDETVELCKAIVPAGTIFSMTDKAGQTEVVSSELKEQPFEKIVIMTDEYTASAPELISAAMQDAKAATVVGQKTYGKGVIQYMYEWADGSGVKLTTMEYLSRNGRRIDKAGVTPDVTVELPQFVDDVIILDSKNASQYLVPFKKALKHLGYTTGAADTYYDDTTKSAVKKFQQDKGLTADGKPSYETVVALNLARHVSLIKDDITLKKAYEVINK